MTHKPIFLKNITLEFPHKICFEEFNASIQYGQRIAITGRNGSGKSSLLRIIKNITANLNVGYVAQVIQEFETLSGGQRFNKALTESLKTSPDILLLDEPTNHLDIKNRRSLQKMLSNYPGTLIIISHDVALLRNLIDIFWHIDNSKVNVFSGDYADYNQEMKLKYASIEHELSRLSAQKKNMHQNLMQEQQRASKSKAKGKKSVISRKWPTITSTCKALQAQETTGKKKLAIDNKKQAVSNQLANLRLPEIIIPKFSITAVDIAEQAVVSIQNASCGFIETILQDINLNLGSKARVVIKGNNGSGKSTLIKAILNDPTIQKSGNWYATKDIGYLDQHYSTLKDSITVIETISRLVPTWTMAETRHHLNDFLFRKTEEVTALVSTLSGGEKARLCLAQIAAYTPRLLILDEVTNNLDLETKEHIIQVLNNYPAALIVISHDEDFLKEIGITESYQIIDSKVIMSNN